MSYTPTTWTSGDIVTSAKLNKIENGIVEASSTGGCEVIQGTYVNNYNNDSGSGGGTVVKSTVKSTSSTSSVLDYSEYIEWPISYEALYNKIMSGTIVLLAVNMSNGNYSMSMCGLVVSAQVLTSENSYYFNIYLHGGSNTISNVDSDFSSNDNIVLMINVGSAPSEEPRE